jgi:hypothetical protein
MTVYKHARVVITINATRLRKARAVKTEQIIKRKEKQGEKTVLLHRDSQPVSWLVHGQLVHCAMSASSRFTLARLTAP